MKVAKLPVTEASDGVKLQPNHVYVGPPGGYLALLNGTLQRMETNASEAPRLPIDYFLRARTGNDFSGFKTNTIRRRIERRMNLHQIKGPAEYLRYLQENPHEIDILLKELLIGVTSFFRDAEAFEALSQKALPELLKSRPDRLWAAERHDVAPRIDMQ